MGLVVFVGKIETGKVYGPFGERIWLVVDKSKRSKGKQSLLPAKVLRGFHKIVNVRASNLAEARCQSVVRYSGQAHVMSGS